MNNLECSVYPFSHFGAAGMPACVGFLEGGQAMGRVSVLCLAGRAAAWLPSQ